MLLEILVGPLWLYLIFSDLPGAFTIIGGVSLVFFLAAHELVVLLGLADDEEAQDEEDVGGNGKAVGGTEKEQGAGLQMLVTADIEDENESRL